MNKKLPLMFLILCFGILFASAQSVKEKPTAPTGLALEVTFLKDRPPAYIAIGESLPTTHWAWYGAFARVPNFQTSAEKPPVQAVKFIPYLDDGTVKIKVRVFTGQKTFENEVAVALYWMREGEGISVKELVDYGVVPFEIAVVRVTPSVSVLPSVENKTKSLQVTAIEPNFSTLPSYKLSVLNNSTKAVYAFSYETFENNRRRISGMPQGEHDEYLIEPGATFVKLMDIPLEYKQSTNGEAPKPANQQGIVISSVTFADGSYEGDALRAAQFRATIVGRKIQYKQIIALLKPYENASSAFNWNKFTEQSAKLETRVGEQEFGELLKQFPALGEREKADLREAAEVETDIIKKEFLEGTARYRADIESSATSRIYLTKLKEMYQKWLARLP